MTLWLSGCAKLASWFCYEHHGFASIAAGAGPNTNPHPLQHEKHPLAHVVHHNCLNRMVAKEAGNSRMVGALCPGVVEHAPLDVELLPGRDFAVRGFGYCHPIGAAPPPID
jgi:hypothetical protein